MIITGEIKKEGAIYATTVEPLAVFAQGRSRAAACEALAESIREHAADYSACRGLRVAVTDDGEKTLYVTASDAPRLLALLLRRQRDLHDLSLADVAERTGARSRNGYAQYEQARREPSAAVLQELLDAVAPELVVAIIPRSARVIPRWEEDLAPEVREALDALVAESTPERATALRAAQSAKSPRAKGKRSAR